MLQTLAIRGLLSILCVLVLGLAHAATDDSASAATQISAASSREQTAPRPDEIETLIEQLGSDAYAERLRAEQRLIQLGAAAYDQLKRSENDEDLEVADRVRYILHQIGIIWVRPYDPVEVKKLLANYSKYSLEDHARVIRQLGRLEGEVAFAPLCRIARFESSARLARRAAFAAMNVEFSDDAARQVADIQRVELGESDRTPVQWLRHYAVELASPRETIAYWSSAVADEIVLLETGSDETDFVVGFGLIKRHLEFCNRLQLVDEACDAIGRMVALSHAEEKIRRQTIGFVNNTFADEVVDTSIEAAERALLRYACEWFLDHEAWQIHQRFVDRNATELRRYRILVYLTAAAYSKQGRTDQGNRTAERAFQMADAAPNEEDGDDNGQKSDSEPNALDIRRAVAERIDSANAVADRGFVDWAKREYRYVVSHERDPDFVTLSAATSLAMWLHDRQQHRAASDVIGELFNRLDANRTVKQRLLLDIKRQLDVVQGVRYLKQIEGYRAYYLACEYERQGDYEKQRQQLTAAAQLYGLNPDVLIAMYHSPDADEAFRQRTTQLISQATIRNQNDINEYPTFPGFYNQWAWLVANTNGDVQKAIEYSHKSLELKPNEPSYLDTLGRCYYAAGDLENAVKYQRRAVELQPHLQVMQRQLDLFESELAKRSLERTQAETVEE